MGLMLTIYLLGCSASVGSHTEGREPVSWYLVGFDSRNMFCCTRMWLYGN